MMAYKTVFNTPFFSKHTHFLCRTNGKNGNSTMPISQRTRCKWLKWCLFLLFSLIYVGFFSLDIYKHNLGTLSGQQYNADVTENTLENDWSDLSDVYFCSVHYVKIKCNCNCSETGSKSLTLPCFTYYNFFFWHYAWTYIICSLHYILQ